MSPYPRNALPGYLLYVLSSRSRSFSRFLSTLCKAYAETNASLITDYVCVDLIALDGIRAVEAIRYEGTSPERMVPFLLCVHRSMLSRMLCSSVSSPTPFHCHSCIVWLPLPSFLPLVFLPLAICCYIIMLEQRL